MKHISIVKCPNGCLNAWEINMNETEIKGVYKCPICGVIDNDRL